MKKLSLIIVFIFSVFMFSSCKIDEKMIPASENNFEQLHDSSIDGDVTVIQNILSVNQVKGKIFNQIDSVNVDFYYGHTYEIDGEKVFNDLKICISNKGIKEDGIVVSRNDVIFSSNNRVDIINGEYVFPFHETITFPEEFFKELNGNVYIYISETIDDGYYYSCSTRIQYFRIADMIIFYN